MITGNEVAVDNQLRRAEKQNQSPANRLLESAASTADAISLATGSVAFGGIARAFGIAKRFTSGLGVATLDENLDHLGDATEAALSRVERNLRAQGVRIDEIERRLNSSELSEGIKAAMLQAQRTNNVKRLNRLALILANGVKENDMEPESLDDMMRAAVELKDADILILGKIYDVQNPLMQQERPNPSNPDGPIETYFNQYDRSGLLHRSKDRVYRSSFSRLESHGLIQKYRESNTAPDGPQNYVLLEEGKKFYERLQEISTAR